MPLVLPGVAPLNYSPCRVLNISGVVEEWTEKTKQENVHKSVGEEQIGGGGKRREGERDAEKEQTSLI